MKLGHRAGALLAASLLAAASGCSTKAPDTASGGGGGGEGEVSRVAASRAPPSRSASSPT